MSSLKQAVHGRDHNPWGFDPLRDLRWFFVTPIAPATKGIDDANDDDEAAYPAFASPWANIGGDAPATAFSVAVGGAPVIRLACTGGEEETLPSLIFTIPAEFLPADAGFHFIDVPMGDDGVRRGTVRVDLGDGSVKYMGEAGVDGGTP